MTQYAAAKATEDMISVIRPIISAIYAANSHCDKGERYVPMDSNIHTALWDALSMVLDPERNGGISWRFPNGERLHAEMVMDNGGIDFLNMDNVTPCKGWRRG